MKKTMKTRQSIKTHLLSFAALCGLTIAFASCANDDVVQKPKGTDTDGDKNLTTFAAGNPSSRTSMTNSGVFYWEAGDKIYVKDDNGTWQASNNAPTTKTASFKFKVPGQFTDHTSYKVYYPGQGGSNDQVSISSTQRQTTPNTTLHFGDAGDCGVAEATGGGGVFNFTLDHQAAYLIFQPYTTNTALHDCYLTKIEVSSDDNIMGSYTFDPSTGHLTGTGTGKQIVLTTKDPVAGSANEKGFPLTNTAASLATNGAYMVIKPGTHALMIRYWVKDYVTGIEGAITKTISSRLFDKNKYYNIVAELDVKDYSGNNYYMWDAQKQYWDGYEWTHKNPAWQPTTTSGGAPSLYAQNSSDLRFYHGGGVGLATQSCAAIPNNNEMTWYTMNGNPHWDGEELWTSMGHLYKSGVWFLKKTYISGYSSTQAYDGSDWRGTGNHISRTSFPHDRPSASEINKYFFVPTLGYYLSGQLYGIGTLGVYWMSNDFNNSAHDRAYCLGFDSGHIEVNHNYRNYGFTVQAYQ